MYSLFTSPLGNQPMTVVEAEFEMYKKQTAIDVEKVIDYYRYGSFFTWGNHLVTKLIKTIGAPLALDMDRYYEVIRARAPGISAVSGLTTTSSPGRIFSGVFYYGCPEIIIARVGDDRPSELVKDWRNLTPVKLLACPISNLNYLPPMGQNVQSERGLVVVDIDVAMLMLMYREFIIQDVKLSEATPERARLNETHFVGKYVIPNMIKSQTDWAIFNRFYNLVMGAPHGEAYRKVPVLMADYHKRLDKGLEHLTAKLSHVKRPYEYYLANIPTVFTDHLTQLPDIAETRQVWWALVASRIKVMELLISLGGREGLDSNRILINQLKVMIKEFRSDRNIFTKLPADLAMDAEFLFNYWSKL